MNLDKIEWWLLKYTDFHSEITTYFKENNINYSPDMDVETHPHYSTIVYYSSFLDFYHFLNEISEYARREDYFKGEIEEYHRRKASQHKAKEWLIKNLNFGLGPYPQFIADANVFREKEEMIVIDGQHDVVFNLDWDDFGFTLEFIELFEELFFEKELLEGFWEVIGFGGNLFRGLINLDS